MDYANLPGYAAAGIAGVIAGAGLGRKMASGLVAAIEARVSAAEKQLTSISGAATVASEISAAEKYAEAIGKLASAIEKHAAAIDDHGAATVAAAVECHAAHQPGVTAVQKTAV